MPATPGPAGTKAAGADPSLLHVALRRFRETDIPVFFQHASDPLAGRMAAFTSEDDADCGKFGARWQKIIQKQALALRTVLVGGEVAGYVVQFEMFGKPSVAYWFGREFWGKGVATKALQQFLLETPTRPLYARVAKDNKGSIRVLEKCGFTVFGEDKGFALARGAEIPEWIFWLPADPPRP